MERSTEYICRLLQLLLSSFIFDAPVLCELKRRVLSLFFVIGKQSYISRGTLLFAPHSTEQASLVIGQRVGIEHHCDLDYSGGLTIEDDVWISEGVLIATHSHNIQTRSLKKEQPISFSSLTIGQDAWIGAGATILAGVTKIGRGAIIGAGSVVTKDVDDWQVVAGNPARLLRVRIDQSTSTDSDSNGLPIQNSHLTTNVYER